MIRHLAVFLGCFVIGAALAAILRVARHDPYAAVPMSPDIPAMPATQQEQPAPIASGPAKAVEKPINAICPICGMPVNPTVPTATYQGKVVGFGCRTCPPTFAANPALYGPAALENRVVEEHP
jgi:YHS domain-containing protein